jgi:hypothetical protein
MMAIVAAMMMAVRVARGGDRGGAVVMACAERAASDGSSGCKWAAGL